MSQRTTPTTGRSSYTNKPCLSSRELAWRERGEEETASEAIANPERKGAYVKAGCRGYLTRPAHLPAKVEHVHLGTGQCTHTVLVAHALGTSGVTGASRAKKPIQTHQPATTIPPFHKDTRFTGMHETRMHNTQAHRTAEIRRNTWREGGPTSVRFQLLRSTTQHRGSEFGDIWE